MIRRFTRISLRILIVTVAAACTLALLGPVGIGVGCGPESNAADLYFGVFDWLIYTRETVRDPITGEFARYVHVVVNPKGTAWTLAAGAFLSAVVIHGWRSSKRLT